MRPDGFYWVRYLGTIQVARWVENRWLICGRFDAVSDKKVTVLGPCILASDGPA